MALCTLLFVANIASSATSAAISIGPIYQSGHYEGISGADLIEQIKFRHSAQLKALHDEGLAAQRADRGILTPTHHAELQARLDRIQESYRHAIEQADPWAVDSLGMRRER